MRTSGLRTRPLGLFSKGDAVMPTRITTRAARVALANRDYEQARAEIEAKIDARIQQLHADPRATDKAAFLSRVRRTKSCGYWRSNWERPRRSAASRSMMM